MRKSIFYFIIFLIIIIVAYVWYTGKKTPTYVSTTPTPTVSVAAPVATKIVSYQNATYIIDGQSTTLSNGTAETDSAPGSVTKITTEYFGKEAKGDLNADGTDDTAFLLTQDGGGTGVFFYLVAALWEKETGKYTLTNTLVIGDRISPKSTEIKNGQVIVNFVDRKEGEPMSAEPTVAVSKYYKVIKGELVLQR